MEDKKRGQEQEKVRGIERREFWINREKDTKRWSKRLKWTKMAHLSENQKSTERKREREK